MKLTDYLTVPLIRVPLAATDKRQSIVELVDVLSQQGLTQDRDRLLKAVLDREAQRTTGIGRGFALPHAKSDAVSRLSIAFGRAASPIEFSAIDGQPVSLVALLASPTHETGLHIQALARLSRLVTNEGAVDALLSAGSPDEFYQVIATFETGA